MYGELLALAYVAVLGTIALIDYRTRRAPNALVYPAIVGGALASIPLGDLRWEAWLGGLTATALMLLVYAAGRGKMGAGDVKTACIAGLAVGLRGVPVMLAGTFLGGSAFALVVLALGARNRRDTVPFTPFLLLGVLLSWALRPGYLIS
ncbi:MAG: A24 family peptidase [Dehalococcoidia bacterium]